MRKRSPSKTSRAGRTTRIELVEEAEDIKKLAALLKQLSEAS
jgi:stress response protein YsnF